MSVRRYVRLMLLLDFMHFIKCSRTFFLFNRFNSIFLDSNRRCLVYMFSLRFSGNQFLINLRWEFRVRKIFRTSTLSKMRNLYCRLLFH